jgi:hypothetical protein
MPREVTSGGAKDNAEAQSALRFAERLSQEERLQGLKPRPS